MNFVYVCRSGENEELRYSIRSVIKNFPDAKIWVVGDPPKWYIGPSVRVMQKSGRYANVSNNLEAICSSKEIPEKFIFMNDDFYIVNSVNKINYFHEGLLTDKFNSYFDIYGRSSYNAMIMATNKKLISLGFDNPLSYELHLPFPVEKSKLTQIIKYKNVLWRSAYGNIFSVGGKKTADVKIYNSKNMSFKNYTYDKDKSTFISTDDSSFDLVYNRILKDMFPLPSKHELY